MQGAPEARLRDRPRQLQPRDDHDGPGHGRRDLHRAAQPRDAHGDHRGREARRAPAQPRRPDRAEPVLAARARRACSLRTGCGSSVSAPARSSGARTGSRSRRRWTRLGIEMPRSTTVTSVEEAERVAADLGYPVVLRPAYTMGGTGGGLVYNVEELRTVVRARPPGELRRTGARRGVGARLGGARARGRPRRQEPDDHGVLHRERRRDGRPHRRLLLHGPDADDHPGAPGPAAGLLATGSSRRSRSSAARTSSSRTTR